MRIRYSAALIAAFINCLVGCADDSDATLASSDEVATLTVRTTKVLEQPWTRTIKAQGMIAAWEDADISSRINGQPVVSILADVGDSVEKGQLLVKFDDENIRNNVAQAQAAVAEASAALDEANANFARTQSLLADKLISEQDALSSRTRAATAEARLASAQAALAAARLQLDYTSIVAPDDGVISEKRVALGQVPQAGQRLFGLIRQNRLEWRAEVLPEQLSQLSLGQPVSVELKGGERVAGSVSRISPELTNDSRMAVVYVELEPDSGARAGMFVTGDLILEQYAAITVPEVSLVLRDGRVYVYEVDDARHVRSRLVQTGRRDAGMVEVQLGLTGGEEIVTAGAGFLSDGQLVAINNADDNGAGS